MSLSPNFEQPLHYAALIHAGQKRKGTTIQHRIKRALMDVFYAIGRLTQ